MIANPSAKYAPFAPIALADRQWPSRTITQAPLWLSTDLRDGNQALFEPMNAERKMSLFKELVRIGFKQIEVGFPAASQTDFDFVRKLIEEKLIPDDVTIMVMTQSREELIARTVEAVKGAPRAIVHLYNATAPAWRRIVFGMSVQQVMGLIAHHVGYLKQLTDAQPDTRWTLQYSPETFSATELEVSLEACHTAINTWGAGPGREVIINLPTTVENATANVFADQIEWMHRHLVPRQHIVLSVHPHNDRGTGVAAAEFAMMAGADRVEGCLFGNGERCGNVDIVTLALNTPSSIFRTSTPWPAWPKSAPRSRCTRATPMPGTWSSPRSRARTRTRSRRALPPRTRTACGKCPTCRSTRPTSAAPMTA